MWKHFPLELLPTLSLYLCSVDTHTHPTLWQDISNSFDLWCSPYLFVDYLHTLSSFCGASEAEMASFGFLQVFGVVEAVWFTAEGERSIQSVGQCFNYYFATPPGFQTLIGGFLRLWYAGTLQKCTFNCTEHAMSHVTVLHQEDDSALCLDNGDSNIVIINIIILNKKRKSLKCRFVAKSIEPPSSSKWGRELRTIPSCAL